MSESLNVIALISGGKDSLFSLLHCIANGHKVVALANLHPSHPTQSGHENSFLASQGRWDATDGENEVPDLNSFMYQTVGYSLIPLYASALQLPLYRRPISGHPTQQTQYYDTSTSAEKDQQIDETEDLIPLLRQVISAHPEANAVSTGAILSTYQRTRIESIALRLHLTPIGCLWQYPVLPPPTTAPLRSDSLTALLDDMAASGLEARIIKLASAGIPEKLLFSKVTDLTTRSQLVRGLTPFFQHDETGLRGAVLGEGGEYETLALSGPRSVWKGGRIEVDESSIESFVKDGVSYMNFGKAKVIPHHVDEKAKNGNTGGEGVEGLVRIPGLLDPQFESVKETLESSDLSVEPQYPKPDLSLTTPPLRILDPGHSPTQVSNRDLFAGASISKSPSLSPSTLSLTMAVNSSTIVINNITDRTIASYLKLYSQAIQNSGHDSVTTLPSSFPSALSSSSPTAGAQLQRIVDLLPDLLHSILYPLGFTARPTIVPPSLSVRNITSTTLLLSSMTDFSTINPIYSKIWPSGLPNPPARVTISTDLPENVLVCLSFILDLGPASSRRGLHVQGRSYWAPANIGPYSQAVAIPLVLRTAAPAGQKQQQEEEDEEEEEEDCLADLEEVHMAGQIPLVPSSMNLHQGSFLDSSVLSLQHLWRVGQERGVDVWPWGVAYLATDEHVGSRASTADGVWRETHLSSTWASSISDDSDDGQDDQSNDEEDTVDVWDLQRNRAVYHGFGAAAMPMSVGKHLHPLPNHQIFRSLQASKQPTTAKSKHIPPFIAAEVIALPRNAGIEWWSTGLAGLARTAATHRKTNIAWKSKPLKHSCGCDELKGSVSCLTISPTTTDPNTTINFVTYLVSSSTDYMRMGEESISCGRLPATPSQVLNQIIDVVPELSVGSSNATLVHGTAFLSSCPPSASTEDTEPRPMLSGSLQALVTSMTIVPCRGLWGRAAVALDAKSPESISEAVPNPGFSDNRLAVAFLMRIDSTATQ